MLVYTHPHIIKLKSSQPFRLSGFGDVHWGARDCAEERFERQVLEEYAEDPLTYFIGMGDIVDAIVTSDQKRYRSSVVKNSLASREDVLDAAIDEFASLWEQANNIPTLPSESNGATVNSEEMVFVTAGSPCLVTWISNGKRPARLIVCSGTVLVSSTSHALQRRDGSPVFLALPIEWGVL